MTSKINKRPSLLWSQDPSTQTVEISGIFNRSAVTQSNAICFSIGRNMLKALVICA